ncbi:hypothetical protein SCALM49S_04748 [Streptomyces californicus]
MNVTMSSGYVKRSASAVDNPARSERGPVDNSGRPPRSRPSGPGVAARLPQVPLRGAYTWSLTRIQPSGLTTGVARATNVVDVTAVIATEALSMRFPRVTALDRLDVGHRTGCDRSGGVQRSRQVHADQDPAGSLPRHRRPGRGARARRRDQRRRHPGTGGVHARSTTACHQTSRRPSSSCTWPACRGCRPRPPANAQPTPCATSASTRSATAPSAATRPGSKQRVEAGPGPRPRPPAGPARRADQRPGPGRPGRDARPHPPHPHRLRHLRPGDLAPPGRAGTHLRPRRRHRRRNPSALQLHQRVHPDHGDPRGRGDRQRQPPRRHRRPAQGAHRRRDHPRRPRRDRTRRGCRARATSC